MKSQTLSMSLTIGAILAVSINTYFLYSQSRQIDKLNDRLGLSRAGSSDGKDSAVRDARLHGKWQVVANRISAKQYERTDMEDPKFLPHMRLAQNDIQSLEFDMESGTCLDSQGNIYQIEIKEDERERADIGKLLILKNENGGTLTARYMIDTDALLLVVHEAKTPPKSFVFKSVFKSYGNLITARRIDSF